MMEPRTYIRGVDGRYYAEVFTDSGVSLEPAPTAQAYVELPGGKYAAVRDLPGWRLTHVSKLVHESERDVKQSMRRTTKFESTFRQFAFDRAKATSGPLVEFVKDERFLDLAQEYRRAEVEGRQRDCEFQPVSTYAHKLITPSGRVIRNLYQGEVGMRGQVVVCLEPGYGTGNQAQVPEQLGDK